MSAREGFQIIVRARREGVMMFAKTNGKLGLKADRPLSDELLTVLKEHKADILALLPPPPVSVVEPTASRGDSADAVERAKLMIWRLRSLGFRPRLDAEGALVIVDAYATGKKRRDVSQRLPIAEVFDDLVAGLIEDPGLLDEEEHAMSDTSSPRGAALWADPQHQALTQQDDANDDPIPPAC